MGICKDVLISWGYAQKAAFNSLKRSLVEAPVLDLPYFDVMFEVECDAYGLGIGAVLN